MLPLHQTRVRVAAGLKRRLRELRARRGHDVQVQALTLHSSVGYRLAAELHRPKGRGPWPGVVLCPDADHPGSVFNGWTEPLNASELASKGFAVLHFDPCGRGGSWGEEDWGGPEHQDNLRVAVRGLAEQPEVRSDAIGVVSLGTGLSMAVGALAHSDASLPVRWLLDWEGPSDRETIAATAPLAPGIDHPATDDFYWRPREPARHVAELSCSYVRVQSSQDHALPAELRHARRMIEGAAEGRLPSFQINEHPPNSLPASTEWYAPGRFLANRVLVRWIRRLTS